MPDYSPLQAWLYSADEHFIAGRALGIMTVFLRQSCGSTWLGFEQIIKTLLLQDCISKSQQHYSSAELGNIAKEYNHKIDKLFASFEQIHPQVITSDYKERLEQVYNFYWARYPHTNPGSIKLNFRLLDELYFKLRDLVDSDVGFGLIERIYIRKCQGNTQEKGDDFAFINNPSFRPRPFDAFDVYNPSTGCVERIHGYPELS